MSGWNGNWRQGMCSRLCQYWRYTKGTRSAERVCMTAKMTAARIMACSKVGHAAYVCCRRIVHA